VQGRRQTYAAGERWARLAEGLLKRLGDPPGEAASVASNIGYLEKFQAHRAEAAAAFERSLAFAQKISPPDPRRVITAQGGICSTTEDPRERIACARRLVEISVRTYGPEHPDAASNQAILAEALLQQKETHAEACALLRQVIQAYDRTVARSAPNAVAAAMDLGQCLAEQAEWDEALRVYHDVLTRQLGPTDRGDNLVNVAYIQFRHGDLDEAVENARASTPIIARALEPTSPKLLDNRATCAEVLMHAGHTAEAQRLLQVGLDAARKAGLVTSQIADLRAQQGMALLTENRPEAAQRALEDALAMHGKAGTKEARLAYTLNGLGAAELALGRPDAARPLYQRAFEVRPENGVLEGEVRADITFGLGRVLGERQRACELVREAAAGYRQFHNLGQKIQQTERWLAQHRCSVEA
jgi:tetratricopeptide (TPR) repeat protein